jgi:hypothetical protein
MKRRSFLKIFASIPAVAVTGIPDLSFAEVPKGDEFIAAEAQKAVKAFDSHRSLVGYMRETIAYDLYTDRYVIRHDITNGTTQWDVTQAFSSTYTDKMVKEARQTAVSELKKTLKKNGIRSVSAPPIDWHESKHVRFS